MHQAPIVGWLLAALTAAAGLHCLARLCAPAARRGCGEGSGKTGGERESDAAEALMGLGMAAMAVPLAQGGAVPAAAWVAVFGTVAAWFLITALISGAARRCAHRLHHAVGAGAMAYMALAMTGSGGEGHPMGHATTAAGLPALTGVLLLYFGGYVLWTGGRLLVPGGAVAFTGGRLLPAPGMPRACRLVMGLGMFAMLLAG